MSCLFCSIIEGKIPSRKVYENDKVYAFEDISPQAPVHVLVIHKQHIKNIDELNAANSAMMADIFMGVQAVASKTGVDAEGYRIIINNGPAAGQVVDHLHIHVLGGKKELGPMLAKG